MQFNRHVRTALPWFLLTSMSTCALAFSDGVWRLEPVSSTHLIEIAQDSQLSRLASSYRNGGFESAGGQSVNFEKWYRPKWSDLRAAWMTQISPQFGMVWGLSTGEQAEKYSISPSLKLGVVYQTKVGLNASFSVRATSVLGGRMRERTCTANYGDIGGIENVNCRLAASEMAPAETLKQLTNALPPDRNNVWIRYDHKF